jgi:sortase (surface protein transpeptidase)
MAANVTAVRESRAALDVSESSSAPPIRLEIPRIGVHTDVIPVGLNVDGTVEVPPVEPEAPAGWYRHLASPGDSGPAVILGHVDSHQGPAVFYRLSELAPGDRISIDRDDGRTIVFTVQSVHTYSKTSFPTDLVYGRTAAPVLRLITCGGAFDRSRRTYLSNVVIFASLIGTT